MNNNIHNSTWIIIPRITPALCLALAYTQTVFMMSLMLASNFNQLILPNMVELSIRYNPDSKDWVIIELQGSVETHNSIPLKDVGLGDLHYNAHGEPILILGHHLLKGKIVKLSNPIGVFEKQTRQLNSTSDTMVDEAHYDYEVIALVRKKIVFSSRPKPILVKYGSDNKSASTNIAT